jgi:uncharacterized protein YggU (UPF0235/DUF167 family)
MNVTVFAIPNAGANRVLPQEDGSLRVLTKAKPEGGKANDAVCALVAQHFKVPRSAVSIRLGKTSREKLLSVAENS